MRKMGGRISLVVFIVVLALLARALDAQTRPYEACAPSQDPERRDLYVATCDSREGWKEFMALRTWNVTGYSIAESAEKTEKVPQGSVPMRNVCKAHRWEGFLTKPRLYLDWIKELPITSSRGGDNHVILMDSDTFWSATDLQAIWTKYDCARGHSGNSGNSGGAGAGKDVLLSTEMSCWVGRYCTAEDIERYYNNTGDSPSHSPFLNSGIVMGKIPQVRKMLEYVIANNASYYIKYFKTKFDDQYAYTDYAFKVAPQEVALDYHQQLLASFSIHAPGEPYEDGWPFACRSADKEERWGSHVCPSCPNWTQLMNKQGYWTFDEDTCMVKRKLWDGMPLAQELATLAPDPVIWHGNGAGKKSYYHYSHQAYLCQLKKRQLTQEHYEANYCCD